MIAFCELSRSHVEGYCPDMQVSTKQHTLHHTCREILAALKERGFDTRWCARHEPMPADAATADLYLGWPEDLVARCDPLRPGIPAIALSLTEHYISYEEKRQDAMQRAGIEWFDPLPRTPEIYDRGYDRADIIITYGNAHIRESYERAGLAEKLVWVPAPIDTEYYRYIRIKKTHSPFTVLAYARDMSPRKGFHDVLAAWRVASRPEWRLKCMGVNPRPSLWWSKIAELPHGNIEALDYLNNDSPQFHDTIRNAHVLLDLSPTEGGETGTMLDSASLGLPAIASPASALDEPDGVAGWVVDPANHGQVAERLEWCDKERIRLQRMGLRARLHAATHHSLPVYRARLHKLFDRVMARWQLT